MDGGEGLFHKKPKSEIQPADAATSSRILASNEELHHDGWNDRHREILANTLGERFHKIETAPELQRFASRILKPFFTTADMVKVNNNWYSYEPPLERIKETTTKERVGCDLLLIAALTNDTDRNLRNDVSNDARHHNVTFKGGKAVYYD